jgi:ADP-ribose pyrophosphatase YjhB (NUDIX family)
MEALAHKIDVFNGVQVDSDALSPDVIEFGEKLQASLKIWMEEKRKGVWLQIPINKSQLISVAVELGFVFHHAEADYVMMTLWLPKTTNKLPRYSSFYVGVGGFVVNDKKEVLVIKEKNGSYTNFWKMPGGSVDPGEDVHLAAVREVEEETGVKTEFKQMLCFRQHNTAAFGKSDLYFVCLLKPLSSEIKPQEDEIAEAKWMPLDEFVAQPFYQGLYKKILEIGKAAAEGNYEGWSASDLPLVFRKGSNTLYHLDAKL